MKRKVKERVQETVADLMRLRDEIRLDLHLANMDLRDRSRSRMSPAKGRP
jgi:hypothetical protein